MKSFYHILIPSLFRLIVSGIKLTQQMKSQAVIVALKAQHRNTARF